MYYRYAPGDSLVEYKTGTSYDGIWKLQHDDSVTAGTVVDFSSGMKQLNRTYGIQAQLAPSKIALIQHISRFDIDHYL